MRKVTPNMKSTTYQMMYKIFSSSRPLRSTSSKTPAKGISTTHPILTTTSITWATTKRETTLIRRLSLRTRGINFMTLPSVAVTKPTHLILTTPIPPATTSTWFTKKEIKSTVWAEALIFTIWFKPEKIHIDSPIKKITSELI